MKLLQKNHILRFALLFLAILSIPLLAHAQPDLGLQYGEYTGLGSRDIRIVVASIVNILLGLLGVFFVILLVVAGWRYLTAQGEPDKTKKAIGTITSAVIGLAIVLSAYIIARFVLQAVLSATTGIVN